MDLLLGPIKHMLPYFMLAFLVCELLLFVKERKGLTFEIIVAIVLLFLSTLQGQFESHSSWAAENRPVLLAVVNSLIVLMPLAVFVAANQFLARIQNILLRHASLFGIVLLTVLVLPMWSLYVTCASGLDCL